MSEIDIYVEWNCLDCGEGGEYSGSLKGDAVRHSREEDHEVMMEKTKRFKFYGERD